MSHSGEEDDKASHQRQSFLEGEGDKWFARNSGSDIAPYMKTALDTILTFVQPESRILEIGCANGRNLAYMNAARPGLRCFGVEPSGAAVKAAQQLYPSLDVQQGTADSLPYQAATFDLVFFGFCLYLVDRDLLYGAVAEADRVLRDNAFLSIVDFDPVAARKRPYQHREGVFSFKTDYSRLFLASGHYSIAHKHSYSHRGSEFQLDPGERVATVVLYKSVHAGYFLE